MRFAPSGTLFEAVIAHRRPLAITDIQDSTTVPEILRGRVSQKVGMVFPLEHAGTFLGTMNIGRREGPQFTADEIETFSGIAGLLGQAVHNARRHEEAERLSVLDELTGLYNHRYFQAQLARHLAASTRDSAPFTLVMLDLDDFKAYNDLFGHQQGDEVLKQVGAVLSGFFPADGSSGFSARYGGEEFVLVIPAGAQEARSVCEEIRLAIGQARFPGHTALERGRITVSLGAAVYPLQADSRDTLIAAADTALYRAKHLGKDRCEFYTSVLDAIETDVIDNSEVAMIKTIKPLVSVINGKDNYTYGHSERVVEHALALGRVLGLSAGDLSLIAYAAFLHDLGKLEISRELLNKTEPLTESEWQTLRNHPVWGAEMVGSIASLAETVPAIRHHHERWDGAGYPDGLAGERIPLFARIIAVVDAFDAMITARPYRREKSVAAALAEISAHAGSQFDPVIAQAFCHYQKSQTNEETRTA
jgi:diguanylate cyclase (GGDEF)-like protein